jgi:hypothetical protein
MRQKSRDLFGLELEALVGLTVIVALVSGGVVCYFYFWK